MARIRERTTRLNKLSPERAARSKEIAVMNNKGGCGKTTTSIALGLHLARAGFNVLFWDNDPQCNLTQRLGMSDGVHKNRRLNMFFRDTDLDNFLDLELNLPVLLKFPYFYKLSGSEIPPGHIAVMGGHHYAEIEADAANKRLGQSVFSGKKKDLLTIFRDGVNEFKQYFDFIIIDTAPAMEGSLLCQLALKTADEIICPIDGLEAATGLKHLLEWMYGETMDQKQPNVLMALVKYQDDTGDLNIEDLDPATANLKNAVYRALRNSLGSYVCENGIKELPSLRNNVYGGFGRKNSYESLCDEMYRMIRAPRENAFKIITPEKLETLQAALAKIEAVSLKKKPEFRVPKFSNIEITAPGPEIGEMKIC